MSNATTTDSNLSAAMSKLAGADVCATRKGCGGAVVTGTKPALTALCAQFGFRYSPGPVSRASDREPSVYLTRAKVERALAASSVPS